MQRNAASRITLHCAIAIVLSESKHPLTVREITSRVNMIGLYHRKDGMPVQSNQISARIRRYPDLFVINRMASPMTIILRGNEENSL